MLSLSQLSSSALPNRRAYETKVLLYALALAPEPWRWGEGPGEGRSGMTAAHEPQGLLLLSYIRQPIWGKIGLPLRRVSSSHVWTLEKPPRRATYPRLRRLIRLPDPPSDLTIVVRRVCRDDVFSRGGQACTAHSTEPIIDRYTSTSGDTAIALAACAIAWPNKFKGPLKCPCPPGQDNAMVVFSPLSFSQ